MSQIKSSFKNILLFYPEYCRVISINNSQVCKQIFWLASMASSSLPEKILATIKASKTKHHLHQVHFLYCNSPICRDEPKCKLLI
jgi:hypothetical protein